MAVPELRRGWRRDGGPPGVGAQGHAARGGLRAGLPRLPRALRHLERGAQVEGAPQDRTPGGRAQRKGQVREEVEDVMGLTLLIYG